MPRPAHIVTAKPPRRKRPAKTAAAVRVGVYRPRPDAGTDQAGQEAGTMRRPRPYVCFRGAPGSAGATEMGAKQRAPYGRSWPKIGIGGRLTAPPLPHHRAYGSRTTAVRSS